GKAHAPADAAGGVSTELLVVVVTRAGLQAVGAEAALVTGEHAGAVAAAHVVIGGAVEVVLVPVQAQGQRLSGCGREIRLQRSAVAAGIERADELARRVVIAAIAVVVVRFVARAARLQGEMDLLRWRPRKLRPERFLQVVRLVATEDGAVVFVLGLGAEQVAFKRHRFPQRDAAARAQRAVAVAVAVGFVREAAGKQVRRAAAGVDAVGALVGGVDAEPSARAASANPGAGLAQ